MWWKNILYIYIHVDYSNMCVCRCCVLCLCLYSSDLAHAIRYWLIKAHSCQIKLCGNQSTHLAIYLVTSLPIYLPTYLPTYLATYLPIYVSIAIYPRICLAIYASINPTHTSIYLQVISCRHADVW